MHSPALASRRRSFRRGLRSGAFRAIVGLILLASSVALDAGVVFLVPVLFVLVVPLEKLFPRHRGQRIRRPGVLTDVLFAISSPALGAIAIAVAIVLSVVSLVWLPGLALRPVVASLPNVLLAPVGAILFDLVGYGIHRLAHEVPFLWRFHSVHHSSEHLDWISGARTHPFDGVLIGGPILFLVAAGFPSEIGGVFAVLSVVTGLLLHANVRFRFRRLQKIVATTEFHHWHHANEPEAIHTNYSSLFPIWDLLFGTYRVPQDRGPSRYGVDEEMPPSFVGLLRYPFIRATSARQVDVGR